MSHFWSHGYLRHFTSSYRIPWFSVFAIIHFHKPLNFSITSFKGDMVKHELRLTSCEFRVTNWQLKSTSWKFKSTSWNSKGQVQIHELRVQIHKLRVQNHELQVQNHEFPLQIRELRVQIHELRDIELFPYCTENHAWFLYGMLHWPESG